MAHHKDSLIPNTDSRTRLWIVLGGCLGFIFGLTIFTQQTQNIFPQLGIYEKILRIILAVGWGAWITGQCKPTKETLTGGVIFSLLWMAGLFFLGGATLGSPITMIGLVSLGILMGILIGTFRLGALIGGFTMTLLTLILSPSMRGSLEWEWVLSFGLMGAAGGSLLHLAYQDIAKYNFGKPKRRSPQMLIAKKLGKEKEETDHEST